MVAIIAQSQFELLMSYYRNQLCAKKDGAPGSHSIIHYLPKSKDGKDWDPEQKQGEMRGPSLTPTYLNFQSLPFLVNEGDQTGQEGIEAGRHNMIIYLQMTDNHAKPFGLLEPSANWVVPPIDSQTARYDGTVCLSRAVFLDGWLIPKLKIFNEATTWIVDEAYWKDNVLTTTRKLEGHLGITEADRKNKPKCPKPDWQVVKNDYIGQVYKYTGTSKEEDNDGLWKVYQESKTTNWVWVPEDIKGGDKTVILITGETEVESYVHTDGIGAIGKEWGWVTAKWRAKVIFDGVKDGTFSIRIETSDPEISTRIDKSFLENGYVSQRVVEKIKKAWMKPEAFKGIADKLNELFKGSWKFIFSGGRDFYIDRACFNRRGDLLAELKYKAASGAHGAA